MGTLNTCVKNLSFFITDISIMMHYYYLQIFLYVPTIHIFFQQIINSSKVVFKIVAKVSDEFEKNFLAQEMMDAWRLVYLQFWFKFSCEETFSIHMALLKMFYCQPKNLGSSQTWILTIIDADILNLHFFSSRSQWSLMNSGLWTNLWIWILCRSFGKKLKSMHYYVFILMSSQWGQSWQWFKSWALWKMKDFFNIGIYEKTFEIGFVNIWIWWFICMHNPFIQLLFFIIKMPSQDGLRNKHKRVFQLETLDHWLSDSVVTYN